MMRHVTWLLLFSALCPLLWAGTTLDTEVVKKAVVFLYAADANGNADERKPLGTGFFILVPENGVPTQGDKVLGQLLLVTARHIVDPAWLFCSEPQPDLIYMRLNKKNYDPSKDSTGVEYVSVRLVENGTKRYLVRDDDDKVDAAIVYLGWEGSSQDKYDFKPLRLNVFASPDEIKNLSIGDSIASAGLLPGRSGEKRNYPFFKFGEISSIPDEPTWVGCGGRVELRLERVWFIAANLVRGNSGSPIFYAPPALLTKGIKRGVIIGVQSSSFEGADIAGMTPVEDVFKLIEQHVPPGVEMDLYRGGDESQRK